MYKMENKCKVDWKDVKTVLNIETRVMKVSKFVLGVLVIY